MIQLLLQLLNFTLAEHLSPWKGPRKIPVKCPLSFSEFKQITSNVYAGVSTHLRHWHRTAPQALLPEFCFVSFFFWLLTRGQTVEEFKRSMKR